VIFDVDNGFGSVYCCVKGGDIMKVERINICFTPEHLEWLRERSEEIGATLSGLIRVLIKKEMERVEKEND
jgi:hypothetical protein